MCGTRVIILVSAVLDFPLVTIWRLITSKCCRPEGTLIAPVKNSFSEQGSIFSKGAGCFSTISEESEWDDPTRACSLSQISQTKKTQGVRLRIFRQRATRIGFCLYHSKCSRSFQYCTSASEFSNSGQSFPKQQFLHVGI